MFLFFFFQAEDGIRDVAVTGVQTCALPICQALMRRSLGEGVLFNAGMLRPAGRRDILTRVLRNLRAAHLAARDWPAALGAVELLAVIEPIDPDHGRDRGLLLGRMGRFNEALAALSQI